MAAPATKMKPSNHFFVLLSFFLLINPSLAFWRLLCHGQLGSGRIDPIVSPGKPSNHVHAGFGAQSFGFDSEPANMIPSNCTSCAVTQDRSLYWTPAMYFQYANNGSFKLLETSGGMTAYYFTNDTDGPFNISAFPQGFKMIAGDFRQRNDSVCDVDKDMSFWNETDTSQPCLAMKAIGFNCLNYSTSPEGSLTHHYMRNKTFIDAQCPQGIRAELMFPSCWNGSLDSADHKSHMAYPNLLKTGDCPDTHPISVPALFYETIWNTFDFKDIDGQFVFAQGDPTGFGYHGDFIAGWNETFLQEAINTCTNSSGQQSDCHMFNLQDDYDATRCLMDVPKPLLHENVMGPVPSLPGNIPIQWGPGYATMGSEVVNSAPSVLPAPVSVPTSVASLVPSSNASDLNTSSSSAPAEAPFPNGTSYDPTLSPVPQPLPPMVVSMQSSVAYITNTLTTVNNGVTIPLVIIEEMVVYFTTITTTANMASATKRHVHKHGHRGGHHRI